MVTITYILAGVCILAGVFVELWKYYQEKTTLRGFGCLRGVPVLGAIPYALNLDNETIIQVVAKVFDTIKLKPFYTWMGTQLIICSDQPDDAQVILNSPHLLKKSYVYESFQMSNGLLCSPVDIWKPHRRALNPTLGGKMVSSFLPIFNDVFGSMARHLAGNIGTCFDPYRMMMIGTYTALMQTSFGLEANYDDPIADEIHHLIATYMHYVERRAQRPWLKSKWIYSLSFDYPKFKAARDALCAHTASRRKALSELMANTNFDEEQNGKRLNFVQKCLQLRANGEFNETDMEDELLVLLVGGTDTSAAAMNAVILMLAIHQECQQLCVDELHDIGVDGIDDPISEEQLSKMSYIEMVIKEALRLYPIGTFLLRENTAPVRLRDATIQTGTQFVIGVYQMHRDPKIWGDTAAQFRPERFLPENFVDIHPYAFLPFSGGLRNCIGLRYAWPTQKIALAHLLRHYKFTTDLKMHEVRFEMNAVSRILNTDVVRLERRQW